ncbi:MAG: hypothetical protein JNJ60_20790 [Rhodocyclaceae bacterium]|nr:hypothetical protein [Rhodocyclaceae bacterium]
MSRPQNIDQALPPNVVDQPLSLLDLTRTLIGHYGVHEGHYELMIEFLVGTGKFGPTPEQVSPGSVVSISRIGLLKVTQPTPQSVDAATCAPPKSKRARKKPISE